MIKSTETDLEEGLGQGDRFFPSHSSLFLTNCGQRSVMTLVATGCHEETQLEKKWIHRDYTAHLVMRQ